MKILYIAAVGTLAYRARHHDTGFELGGLRKAQMSIDALTRAGHDVMMLSSAVKHCAKVGVASWLISTCSGRWDHGEAGFGRSRDQGESGENLKTAAAFNGLGRRHWPLRERCARLVSYDCDFTQVVR